MPNTRNHICVFFSFSNLAAALSGNGQSAKSIFYYSHYFLNTRFKIKKSAAAAVEFWNLNSASYQITKQRKLNIQKTVAVAAEIRTLNLASYQFPKILKLKNNNSAAAAVELSC